MIPKEVADIRDLLMAQFDVGRESATAMGWAIYNAGFRNSQAYTPPSVYDRT